MHNGLENENVNDFISAIRTDRIREMKTRKKSGIDISNEYMYRIVDTIIVRTNNGEDLEFGFQANQKDVYFYIIDGGANSYYTIVELYDLLKIICDSGNKEIVYDVLHKIETTEMKKIATEVDEDGKVHEKWENRADFLYRDVVYHLKDIEYPDYNRIIEMPDGAKDLSYIHLFVLLNLIQEKSNALFTRGDVENSQFVNGIMRLFICLLKGKKNYAELERMGWFYDEEEDRYFMDFEKVEDKARKYYLTKEEYLGIIKSES